MDGRAGAIFEPSTDGNCDFNIVLAQAAPLMQEQSIFLDGCAINEYPLDSELWIG